MTFRRGAIYLASLNPTRGTEPGKTRPCVVIQNDLLSAAGHPSTTVLPLTSQLIEGAAPLRLDIKARDGLRLDSQVLVDQICTIDKVRISDKALTQLTEQEMALVEAYLKIVIGSNY
jgi:mRNA interferase MazF